MSEFNSAIAGDGSASVLPSSYQLQECSLYTNSGKKFLINDLVTGIQIEESLYKSSMKVSIRIEDSINFLENTLISGNERIRLRIKHTELKKRSRKKKRFIFEVFIVEINNFERVKPGMTRYQIECFSEHMYINSIKKLSRPFKGSIGSIVKDICRKDLKLRSFPRGTHRIKKINTETKDIVQGIFPNIRPLNAISWLLRNSFDNKTQYYFYETAKDGINFNSYENLINEDVYRDYNQRVGYSETEGTEEYYKEIQERITKLRSTLNLSKLVSVSAGAYASTMHTLDLSTKKYSKLIYDYDVNKPKKLNRNIPFSKEAEIDGVKYNQGKDSYHHFLSLNENAYNLSNYHAPAAPTLLNSEAQKENLETMTQEITVAGDYEISVGKIIRIIIPKSLGTDATGLKDKLLGGKYMITNILHQFGTQYNMVLTIQKDSSDADIDGKVI